MLMKRFSKSLASLLMLSVLITTGQGCGSSATTTQEKVDLEIRKIIETAQTRAMDLLKKHRSQLDAVSRKLLEVETLDSIEFEKVIKIPKARRVAKKS